jgi:hypothetical protein
VLELPELEQRLSNLQTQVERLWRNAEAHVPPVEQRLAAMADQYAEYLKRWAATVERHTQAVSQLEAYAAEWKDATTHVRQETAERLQDLESTIEREWDTLKRMQEQPIRELREQAESLTQVSLAMATASQQGVDRAEARFASFESEVHLRLSELTRELQAAVAEMKARLDRQPGMRPDPSSQWSLDEVTRLHGQLRDGVRPAGEFPHTIDHPPASAVPRELPEATVVGADNRPRFRRDLNETEPVVSAIPTKWAAAGVVVAAAVVLAIIFGWRMQRQITQATEQARISELKANAAVTDAARQLAEARQVTEQQAEVAREMANRTQRIADVIAAPDLIRYNLFGGNGASGQALFSRSRGFVVSGSHLAAPPAGTLQAWLLTPQPVKAGTVTLDPDGTATLVQQLSNLPARVVGVMITAEASEAVESPAGAAVLTSVRAFQPSPEEP